MCKNFTLAFFLFTLFACGKGSAPSPKGANGDSNNEKKKSKTDSSDQTEESGTEDAPNVPFYIVSDLDDTLKQTNSLDPIESAYNDLFSNDAFIGMEELLTQMIGEGALGLYIVTGKLQIFEGNVTEFLTENQFIAPAQIYLKDITENYSTVDHKNAALEELRASHSENFVLIGDDTETDPEIYAAFALSNPGRVSAIYIHKVQGLSGEPLVYKTFITAFDLAYWEMQAGRLSSAAVQEVGRTVLNTEVETLIPDFAVCPTNDDKLPIAAGTELSSLYEQIWQKITSECHE